MSYFARHIAPRVFESDFSRALIGQFDVTRERLPHWSRDFVPPFPHLEQFGVVAAVRHDARDLIQIQATVLVIVSLAGFVGSICPCRNAFHCALIRVSSSASLSFEGAGSVSKLQQLDFAIDVFRQRHAIEPVGILHEFHRRSDGRWLACAERISLSSMM